MADTTSFKVVVDHEEQYSMVPADQKLSGTWREAGLRGTQKQCLQYIEEIWTDMTPDDYRILVGQLNLREEFTLPLGNTSGIMLGAKQITDRSM